MFKNMPNSCCQLASCSRNMKLSPSLQITIRWSLLFSFVVNRITAEDDPYWFNVSVNRTITQSDSAVNGEPWKAVDGKSTPAPDTCSRTLEVDTPYIMVDFGREIYPTVIAMMLDYNNVAVTHQDITARLGNSVNHVENNIARRFNIWKSSTWHNTDIQGRYLSIEVPGTAVLAICEISVFQIPLGNIAFRKSVEASNLDRDPRRFHQSQRIVTAWMHEPWIKVDLLDSFFIREIILFTDWNNKLTNFDLRIGDLSVNEGRDNPPCAEHQTLDTLTGRSYFCRMKGRYVVLKKEHTSNTVLVVSDLIVNPFHEENIAYGRGLKAFPESYMDVSGFRWFALINNNVPSNGGFISTVGTTGNWLRVNLDASLPVAKIVIASSVPDEYKNQLVDFELRVGDSLENNGNSNPLCLEGLQSMKDKEIDSFFCSPRLTGKYVNLDQKTTDKHLAITEIAVFSESAPEIKDRDRAREVWHKIGDTVVLSCTANGYPTPELFWIKDGTVLSTGSSSLQITSALFNDSGTYECWANNSWGEQYMPIEVSVTSDLRPCIESLEIQYDLSNPDNPYPAGNVNLLGNKWYRFYDRFSMTYLKMTAKAPTKKSACHGWIRGGHPGVYDGVVDREACMKEEELNCNHQFDIHVRNCPGFYVYNLPSWREVKEFYCFQPDTDVHPSPVIATMANSNSALYKHVLHVEPDVSDSMHCLLLCTLKKECQSFNFSKKEKMCELNSSTNKKNPTDFLTRSGYHYYVKGKGMIKNKNLGDL